LEYVKKLQGCVLIVFSLIYFTAGPVLAGQSDLDDKIGGSGHAPQSRFSSEIDIPISKDEEKRHWTKKNRWAVIIGVVLLAGSAALLGSQVANGGDDDAVPHTDTGGVKGSW
jgi:hypothetical protein